MTEIDDEELNRREQYIPIDKASLAHLDAAIHLAEREAIGPLQRLAELKQLREEVGPNVGADSAAAIWPHVTTGSAVPAFLRYLKPE